ncbi:MAG: M23 family metallopeptidase [Alphaproteobacteria bacterium]|nr:M23 family metallopeptidase [Alphaproteobacteria bacterium]
MNFKFLFFLSLVLFSTQSFAQDDFFKDTKNDFFAKVKEKTNDFFENNFIDEKTPSIQETDLNIKDDIDDDDSFFDEKNDLFKDKTADNFFSDQNKFFDNKNFFKDPKAFFEDGKELKKEAKKEIAEEKKEPVEQTNQEVNEETINRVKALLHNMTTPFEAKKKFTKFVVNNPLDKMYITSYYGMRIHPVTKVPKKHIGIDLRGNKVPVYAIADGYVSYAGVKTNYGNIVEITHKNGYQSRYAHLNTIYVKKGQPITAHDTIGLVGQTGRVSGPHLHFEIRLPAPRGAPFGDTVDPVPYLINVK